MGFRLVVARMLEKHIDQGKENPLGPTFLRMRLGSRPDYAESSSWRNAKLMFYELKNSVLSLTLQHHEPDISYNWSIKLITFHMLFPMSGVLMTAEVDRSQKKKWHT